MIYVLVTDAPVIPDAAPVAHRSERIALSDFSSSGREGSQQVSRTSLPLGLPARSRIRPFFAATCADTTFCLQRMGYIGRFYRL